MVDASAKAAGTKTAQRKREPLPASFREATGQYYGIVDDENWLEPDYLRQGMMFPDRYADVAVIGGGTVPEFPARVAVPADFEERYSNRLACRAFIHVRRIQLDPRKT